MIGIGAVFDVGVEGGVGDLVMVFVVGGEVSGWRGDLVEGGGESHG